MRGLMADGPAFGVVFTIEAVIFVAAAAMAARIMERGRVRGGDMVAAE